VSAQNDGAYVCMQGAMKVRVCVHATACSCHATASWCWKKSMCTDLEEKHVCVCVCVFVYMRFSKEWGDKNVGGCTCRC
jgi:hypothetical protein